MIEVLNEKLPSNEEVATLMLKIPALNREQLAELRGVLMHYYIELSKFMDIVRTSGEEDFMWQPEDLYKVLNVLQERVGALQTLAVSLSRKAKFFALEDISNEVKMVGGKEKTYTDKEKDAYARAQTADLEGVEVGLESLYKIISDRLYPLKGTVRGGWF